MGASACTYIHGRKTYSDLGVLPLYKKGKTITSSIHDSAARHVSTHLLDGPAHVLGEELRGGGVRLGGEVAGALVRGAVVEAQAAVHLDQLPLHVPLLPRRLVQRIDVLRDHGQARVEVGQPARGLWEYVSFG